MKKIFLILAFLLAVSFTAMADGWIGLDYYVDAGWASSQFGGWTATQDSILFNYPDVPFRSFYTTLGFDTWIINHFFVGASITTQIQPSGSITNWNPTFTNYMFETGAQFGIVRIVYRHNCTHPDNTYQYAYRVNSVWGEGAIDQVYLELHSSIGSVPK